jgi:hypothetical protein
MTRAISTLVYTAGSLVQGLFGGALRPDSTVPLAEHVGTDGVVEVGRGDS